MPNASKSSVSMHFDLLYDNTPAPEWFSTEFHTQIQHGIIANVISCEHILHNNVSYCAETAPSASDVIDLTEDWPLRSNMEKLISGGISIIGSFDATDFKESPDVSSDKNYDFITLTVSSFETDSPTSSAIGVPNFQLLPCEELHMSLALEYHTLLDRPNSHCRNDYPDELKALLKLPITPNRLFNAMLVPNLPYDKLTCNKLCSSKYWLQKCGCFVDSEIWGYAGQPENSSLCANTVNNCSRSNGFETPTAVLAECKCYEKCSSFQFRITGTNKIRYSYGEYQLTCA